MAAMSFWYHEHRDLDAVQAQIISSELKPIAMLLEDDMALIQQLKAERFTENDDGIFESYLVKIRRDGVSKHGDMKQRLDALAENDTAIVTLVNTYAPYAKTPGFLAQADKFRNYASASRDRWNSVMELFMAGGNYTAAAVQLPTGFQEAVREEMRAAR